MPGVLRVSSRNARFQQWQALLGNRNKRQRAGEFLVQGVRPISLRIPLASMSAALPSGLWRGGRVDGCQHYVPFTAGGLNLPAASSHDTIRTADCSGESLVVSRSISGFSPPGQ